uniref:Uncharacterized protein n=1 Tax=Strigamia maritima TaxID=126957 RepID=T1J7F1_STRMM
MHFPRVRQVIQGVSANLPVDDSFENESDDDDEFYHFAAQLTTETPNAQPNADTEPTESNTENHTSDQNEETPDEHNCEVDSNANPNTANPKRGPGQPHLAKTGKPGRPKKVYAVRKIPEDAVTNFIDGEEIANFIEGADPTTAQEALNSNNREEWTKALKDEYDALIRNGTWEEVKRLQNRKTIGILFPT